MREHGHLKSATTRCRKPFWICSVIVIMFFSFSCGGKPEKSAQEEIGELEELYATAPVENEDPPYEGGTIFRMHMQSLDECEDALIDSVDRQDWEAIKKCAMDLKNASAVVFTGKDKKDLPKEFIIIDTKFHYQALAVVEAAESREMVRLNIEYEKLRDTCDACHEKYKTKDM
ncbi:MAG: cytochrome c [Candidatus Brocadiaceae bacterium]|nr:cytochrome c [Candidatus Brocadiaceae bacterium]